MKTIQIKYAINLGQFMCKTTTELPSMDKFVQRLMGVYYIRYTYPFLGYYMTAIDDIWHEQYN